MEEENLNVDDYIYTSINNDKELLNLPDGSIIKRVNYPQAKDLWVFGT